MDSAASGVRPYDEVVAEAVLARTRRVLTVGICLYFAFTALDHIVYPQLAGTFLTVRVVVSAVLAAGIGLTYVPALRRVAAWLADAMVLSASAGICLMIRLADGPASAYHQGLNLVILATFAMNAFHPAHVAATGAATLGLYLLAVSGPGLDAHAAQVVVAAFFIASTVVLVTLMTRLYRDQHRREHATTMALADTARALADANRLKDDFLANVSHELRTPLTLVLAPLESLLAGESGTLPEAARRHLETMHNNAVRLLQMVVALLDFSRIEAGRVQIRREPVEIVGTTRAIVADLEPAARRKRIDLGVRAPAGEVPVEMDRYAYERILFNLLSNALKFTPEGGRVDVEIAWSDGRLRVAVRDTGIGIAPEDVPRVFERFRQVEGSATRRFEGSGLGLALVDEFARLLDGRVAVTSEPGRGSTFTADLSAPAATGPTSVSRPTAVVQRFEAPTTAAERGAEGPKVLVAEDNLELASYVLGLLAEGHRTRHVRDGEAALQAVRQWQPDLVVSDVMMPRMDGLALCRAIKAEATTEAIPVLLLTALTQRGRLLEGWQAGADDYLFKPFHPRELVARVRTLLAAGEARRRAESVKVAAARTAEELQQLELFARVTSHDLQEPLRKIGILSDLLVTECEPLLDEAARDYLARLQANARRMARMIERLREFSTVTETPTPFGTVSTERLVARVVASREAGIAAAGIRVDVGALPPVHGDAQQIEQLFGHLVDNAIAAAPKRIGIAGRAADGQVELVVEDDGVGFDPRHADRLFEPFARVRHAEDAGVGMGLAICRKIVLRHGGAIAADGRPGEGARFRVTLAAA